MSLAGFGAVGAVPQLSLPGWVGYTGVHEITAGKLLGRLAWWYLCKGPL